MNKENKINIQRPKLLSIEDEKGIQEGLAYILSDHYDLDFADNGTEGIKKALRSVPDLILLDLKMPGLDGFQVCKLLRDDREFDNVPIIVVSAFNNSSDRTKAFELGADDYVTKPFDSSELLARIQRKINSRQGGVPKKIPLEIELDARNQQLKIDSETIQFSATEFKIFQLLYNRLGQVVSREEMVEVVWEKQEVSSRLLDPHILCIRQKLKDHKLNLQSIYGKGYIIRLD